MRGVYGGAAYTRPKRSSLDLRILLSVNTTAQLMTLTRCNAHFSPEAADFFAVGYAAWRTVVASSQNALILNDDRTYLAAKTCRPLGNQFGNRHEVFIPGFSHLIFTLELFVL